MSILYKTIEDLCAQKGVNITEMCRDAKVPRSALSDYKQGRKQSISIKNLEKIADYFAVSIDLLTGRTAQITPRDNADIAKDMQRMMESLEHGDTLMFDGDPLSDEAKESILAAMKLGLEAAKVKNKERFTPKKYRRE